MTYIVEQKIKGRIYLYEVTSFWDKNKKQSRQKRKYIGSKERIYNKSGTKLKKPIKTKPSNFTSKSYGDVFLIDYLQKELGLYDFIKQEFYDYKEILALTAFMIQESSASYLFPYWHEEHYLSNVKKLNSQSLSEIYECIGRNERGRLNFLKDWSNYVNPSSGIYYDITSISSYSTNIESVEWGYNRDKEQLPQINTGIIQCRKTSLPISYNVHPGSIVDVTTLKNAIKTFDSFNLKNLFFILDRGFCSISNILQMYKNKMSFIQPLSFSLKKAKDLVSKYKSKICKSKNVFCYNEEILYHVCDKIELNKIKFNTHIFYNEKASINYKHYLYKAIIEIEKNIEKLNPFKNKKECEKYIENNIIGKYKKYFKATNKTITRNLKEIENAIFRAGTIILLLHGEEIDKIQLLEIYRNRDSIEKSINSLKNHMDTKRIRAHNQDIANGRLFVKFIALIVITKIMSVIKKDKKLKKYSINEIMAELKKLKINTFDENCKFLTEFTKKQKLIFKAFKIDIEKINL